MRRCLLVLLLGLPMLLHGQVDDAVEQWLMDEGNEAAASELHDRLAELAAHPVNINDTQAVASLPFITPFHAKALKNYIRLYGELLSLKELAFVPGFDSATIALIAPFADALPVTREEQWRPWEGRHTLTTGIGGTVEQAAGYSNGRYEGDNLHALMCYSYNYRGRLQVRLSADKDPTEAWGHGNFYAYHLALQDIGRLEKLVVGRYNLQFGQGLTLWTGMAPFDITGNSPVRFGSGIRPASPFGEDGYQEGVAATVSLPARLRLSGFSSWVGGESLIGGHAEWRRGNLIAGITAAHSSLRDSISPRDYPYNQNAFRGTGLTNISLDGAWQYGPVLLYGEAAIDHSGNPAATVGATLSLDGGNMVGVSLRHYHPLYHSLHAQGYGIGGTQGEQGVRIDLRTALPLHIHGLVSADIHRFTSLRYASYSPAEGGWLRMRLDRRFGRHFDAILRYSYRQKSRNIPNLDSALYAGEHTTLQQAQVEMKASAGSWTLSLRGMLAFFGSESSPLQRGRLVAASARHTTGHWQATATFAAFNTDGYYTRFYLSESNIQYAWSMPALYGHGLRGSLLLRYSPGKRLSLAAKYALSAYPGQEYIGSGDSRTSGPIRQTWHLQMRWNL